MTERSVANVYQPAEPHELRDEIVDDVWRYAVAAEVDEDGEHVPAGSNTVVFRIFPGGMTEPVSVAKREREISFLVSTLAGRGECIRATAGGEVETIPLARGTVVTIAPGDTYMYKNSDAYTDLVLHDVATPAFCAGDEVGLVVSRWDTAVPQRAGYLACVAVSPPEAQPVQVAQAFYDLAGQALASTAG